jgi:hypothetical protein
MRRTGNNGHADQPDARSFIFTMARSNVSPEPEGHEMQLEAFGETRGQDI